MSMKRNSNIAFARLVMGLALVLWVTPAAHAQGTGRSMDIDLSIPSAGMGGASNAQNWDDLNYWGNPALLGNAHGVRYLHTRTQLVPGLASDVYLTSNALELGGGGVGVVFSGKPVGLGGVRLDYGQSEGRDENGNFTGTYNSYETVHTFAGGVSAMRVIENVMRLAGGGRVDWSRYADVSFGAAEKRVKIALAPQLSYGTGSTTARDWGFQARVTPYDGFRNPKAAPVRIDLAYGKSVLGYNDDALVTFLPEAQASPVTRQRRNGVAAHLAAGRIAVAPHGAHGLLVRSIIAGLVPLVSVTGAIDAADLGGGSDITYHTDGVGIEVTLANIVSIRHGHFQDLQGQIDGDTWGWGVGLPLGPLGGARFDAATIPQARGSGLGDVHRSQVTAWIDPVAVIREFSSE